MSKRILRWLLPLVVLALAIALAFAMTPLLSSHAASNTPSGTSVDGSQSTPVPNVLWGP